VAKGERSGVIVLEMNTCWALLRSAEVGRLATSDAGHPDIFPINYLVDHGTVVFRTGEGTKLAAAIASPDVAFEVDGYEPDAGEAWSVVVKGRAEEIKNMHEVLEAMTFPLFPWHAGPKHRFMRIVPDDVSGRRFHVVDPAAWRTSLTDAPHASPE
jgi:nitroimidazol reductase NimA-like FMN-containing flavoprotein (pyridoxamine 5'-phosphate oxidase superfamily)